MNIKAKSFLDDTSGNFAIMASIFMGALILLGAATIEVSRMISMRAQMQDMADSAALAGAYIAKNELGKREAHVRENILLNQGDLDGVNPSQTALINFNDDIEEVSVEIPVSFQSFFSGILGKDLLSVRAKSTVSYKTEKVDPVTIAFALDVSGSMGWGTVGTGNTATGASKIDVLKQSTKILFNELEAGTPNPDLLPDSIRTGMSAYNTALVDIQDMNWGWSHLEGAVDGLLAQGGTNSTPALDNAYKQIKDDRLFRKSNDPKFNPSTHREYVIFMTDGDNNQIIWDEDTATTCNAMRNDGIEMFSIAFTAPEKGEVLLLDCASWNDGVEKADDPELKDFAALDDQDEDEACQPPGNAFGLGNDLGNANGPQGNAYGHCKAKKEKEDAKSDYYFDANNAATFKAAFARIGAEIANLTIRVKS